MEKLTLLPKYQELFKSKKSDSEKMESILEDTIKYFNIKNRCGEKHKVCRYSPVTVGKEGITEGCAIGRLFDEESKLILDKMQGGSWAQITLREENIPLIDPFMIKNKSFFARLQFLHDDGRNWNEEGINEKGIETVSEIRNAYITT